MESIMKLAMPSGIDLLARELVHLVVQEFNPVSSIKQIDVHGRIHRLLSDYDGWRQREADQLRELLFDRVNVNPQPVMIPRLGPSSHKLEALALKQKRSEAMAAMYREGKTLEEVGAAFKVTRERVRQLINGLVSSRDGGQGYKHKLKMQEWENSPARIKSKLRAFFKASWDRDGACRIAGIEHDPAWSDIEFCQKIYDTYGLVHIYPYLRCCYCFHWFIPAKKDRRCKPCVAASTRMWSAKPENKLKAKAWQANNPEKMKQYIVKYQTSEKGKQRARERYIAMQAHGLLAKKQREYYARKKAKGLATK